MMTEEFSQPDEMFSSESCLKGCGGVWEESFSHAKFPEKTVDQKFNINILEMLSVILCVRLWGSFFKGKCIRIFCDNFPVCCVINSGRELAFLNTIYECEVRVVHLETNLTD